MIDHEVTTPTPCGDAQDRRCDCGGDGRIKRRLRNRQAVLDALGELIRNGIVSPTLEDVAREAGVSTRSVYRHFGSMEEARDEWATGVVDRILVQVEDASGPILRGASLADRCESLVRARLELHREVDPVLRHATAMRLFSIRAEQQWQEARERAREQVAARLAPEVAALSDDERCVRLAVVNTLLSYTCLDELITQCDGDRTRLVPTLAGQIASAISD